MKLYNTLILIILGLLIASCGKGTVDVTNESYEPKIVVEGILQPHHPVTKIRISKNFPIDKNLRRYTLIFDPDDTEVTITDDENGNMYPLTLHIPDDNLFDNYYYEYRGNDLDIDYGKSYTLEVTTVDRGRELYTRSTTTVPQEGFEISSVNYDSLPYRPEDQNGNLINFQLNINRAPGTTFYATSIKAMDARTETFIYDNPFTDEDPQGVRDDLNAYIYDYNWLMDTPAVPGQTLINLYWISFWFYSDYEIITYAVDQNYEYFLETYNDVQEDDGNFHEARFSFEGDGVGVFGSAVSDTLYVKVLKEH